MKETFLSHDEARAAWHYEPETGAFTWLQARGQNRIGDRAGFIAPDGYRNIKYKRKNYCSGRLAIFWMTGKWPPQQADHRNLKRADDRWENLRPATVAQNCANRTSGGKAKGVSLSRGKWRTQICKDGVRHHIGTFDSKLAARRAYIAKARELNGDFARP